MVKIMAHDVFISYSSDDKTTADAICHVLEENNVRCWIAPRNITSGKPFAEEIMDGLLAAKIVVLVFSESSQNSPYVNNEIDTAFSNNKPILSFKIDEFMPENRMEFFLRNNHWLEAYPEPEKVFETLVHDVKLLCEEEENKTPDPGDEKPEKQRRTPDPQPHNGGSISKTKLAIGAVVLILAVALVGMFAMGNTTSDVASEDTGFDIKISNVTIEESEPGSIESNIWKYSYDVYGSVNYEQDNISGYEVQVKFYDASNSMVESDKAMLERIDKGSDESLCSVTTKEDSITKVVAEIVDSGGKSLAQSEYSLA